MKTHVASRDGDAAFSGAAVGSTFVAAAPATGARAAAVAHPLAAGCCGRLPAVGGGASTERFGAGLRRVAHELVDGVWFVVRSVAVRTPLLAIARYRVLLGVGFVILVLVADYRYELEAPGYGMALAVMGVGAFAGAAIRLGQTTRPSPKAGRPTAGSKRRRKRLAAILAGALPSLAFPAADLWVFGVVGLVPLLWLLADSPTTSEAAWRGWLGGTGYMIATHQWLVPATGAFTIPAALLLGALWIPWALVARAALRKRRRGGLVTALVVVPAAFVLTEYVRSWDRLGGAWGVLGTTQWNNEVVLAMASLGGVWLVSVVLVAANVLVYTLVKEAPDEVTTLAVVLSGCLIACVAGFGMLRPAPQSIGAMRVGGVQAGVIHDKAERFATHEALSADLAAANLDLVVWAESSVGFDLETHPEYAERLQALAARLGSPLLVNVDARRSDGRGIAKAAVLIGPSGVAARYDKMRLVPFGEYIPLRGALGWIASVSDAAAEDRQTGDALAVIEIGERGVGPLICFESAFPDLARELAHQGADVVVVQTATTTFQGSWAQPQHASLAAVRAVESGRSVVHASVSGVTAAFGPTGERLLWVEDGVVGTWVVTVPVAEASTIYVTFGDWLPKLAMVILVAAFLGSRLETGRRRPKGSDNEPFVAPDADVDRPSESGERHRRGAGTALP